MAQSAAQTPLTSGFAIPPTFDHAEPFTSGLALVSANGKFGWINKAGRWAIPPRFDHAWAFSDGIASVKIGGQRGGWAFIDRSGKLLSNPKYERGAYFDRGIANVRTRAGVSMYIDKQMREVAAPKRTPWLWPFFDQKTGLYGYEEDKVIKLAPRFKAANPFPNGAPCDQDLAFVAVEANGLTLWGAINRAGATVIEPQFDAIPSSAFCGPLVPVRVGDTSTGKFGFIDRQGRIILEPVFEDAQSFSSDGIASVKLAGKWGMIDAQGRLVVQPQYQDIRSSVEGLAPVQIGSLWGYIRTINSDRHGQGDASRRTQ